MSPDNLVAAASGIGLTVACPGSLRMRKAHPRTKTHERAAEGTAAHWVVEQMLANFKDAATAPLVGSDFLNATAPNGVVINQEMVDAAEVMVGTLLPEVTAAGGFGRLHIEESLNVDRVHPINKAKPDYWLYNVSTATVHLFDFKFGRRFVEPFENYPLINYAAGVLEYLGESELQYSEMHTRVHLTIVQPCAFHRDGPIRTWRTTAVNLRGYINHITNAVNLAIQPTPPTYAGRWCKDCSARYNCHTLQTAALDAEEVASEALPVGLTTEQMGKELIATNRALSILTARASGLEDQLEHRLRKGESTPTHSIQPKYSSLKWSPGITPDDIAALGAVFGVELTKTDPITPAQAIKKGIDEGVIKTYASRTMTHQLIETSLTKAKKVFST